MRVIGVNKLIKEKVLLDAVITTGTSTEEVVQAFNKITFYITATGVTSGGTVLIEGSYDNVNWATLDSSAIVTNGTEAVSFSNVLHKYMRANLSVRTDGTYTVSMIAGE